MRTHRLVVSLSLMLLLIPAVAVAQDDNPFDDRRSLWAQLSGSGFGFAKLAIDLETNDLCYQLSVAGTGDAPVAAHIHEGGPGVAGPVVVPLEAPEDGLSKGCIEVDAGLVAAILANPSGYYVNVHTALMPAGAVRGQLMLVGEQPTGEQPTPGEFGIIQLIGNVNVSDQEPELIADVAVFGTYAYLARWGGADCGDPEDTTVDGGAYVIDISDPANPVEVGFIQGPEDSLVGEGLQVINIDTPSFTGDVLLMNHEGCGENFQGGVSLWDVTDPLSPQPLAEAFGDLTVFDEPKDPPIANQTHSAFMWDAGDSAYLVSIDDEEAADVDIFDITDPSDPQLLVELDLNAYNVDQPELGLVDSFSHDVVVKQIDGRWIMLVSYWDGGNVLLDVTDPSDPVFLGDTDFPAIDPELLEQTGVSLTPEGNAHQAEFTADNQFVITTDEDFDPYRLQVPIGDVTFLGMPGANTAIEQAEAIAGTPVFVGLACPADPEVPGNVAVPPAPADGTTYIAVVERGGCFFEDKAQSVLAAGGYDAMIVLNQEGPGACTGAFSPFLEAEIPTIMVGRDAGFAIFNVPFDLAACLDETPELAPITIGAVGNEITGITSAFDAWGYVHLFGLDLGAESATLAQLDTFAIPEAMDPEGLMDAVGLSVHEVATDPTDPNLAYLSYYGGGLRAIEIQCADPADTSTCNLVEVGGYLDPSGNNFWGVQVWTHPETGEEYILASDMDSGLWIFQAP